MPHWTELRDREMAAKKRLGLLKPGGAIYMPGPNTGKTVIREVQYGDFLVKFRAQKPHAGLAADHSRWEIWPWSEEAGRHVSPRSRFHAAAETSFLLATVPSLGVR